MRPQKGLYEYHIAVTAAKKRLTKVKKPKEEEYSKNTQTSLKTLELLLSPENMVATIAQ